MSNTTSKEVRRELHQEMIDDAKEFLKIADPNDNVRCNLAMDRINHHEKELSLLDRSLLD